MNNKRVFILCLALVLAIIPSLVSSCWVWEHYYYNLIVENQTDEVLNVHVMIGVSIQSARVQPSGQVVFKKFPTGVDFSITAISDQGQTIFRKYFSSISELQEIESGTFKFVIQSFEKSSNNVTADNTTAK